jgi:RimJ/RimL family protein N-acetyltransferase
MRRSVAGYQIDDDPARIDPGAAVSFLTSSAYWGRWRGEQDIRRQIAEAWRLIGAYDAAGAMVGFARAFSDGGSAYLADVYVLPAHRGAGLGKALVAMMIEDGNQRSRDAMQRIGARFEGILRAHRLGADGQPRDSVRFSVTAAEWPSVRLRLDELSRRYQPA